MTTPNEVKVNISSEAEFGALEEFSSSLIRQIVVAKATGKEYGELASQLERVQERMAALKESMNEAGEVKPVTVSDQFEKVISDAAAARQETESYANALGRLNGVELAEVAARWHAIIEQTREAGQSTDEYEQRLQQVYAAQDGVVDRQIEASAAAADAAKATDTMGEAMWARANDAGTLASAMVDVRNSIRGTTAVANTFKNLLAGNFVGAARSATAAMRALTVASSVKLLLSPWTALAAVVAGIAVYFFKITNQIRAINDEIKKTNEEGMARLAENAERAYENGQKLAEQKFDKIVQAAKDQSDYLERSLRFSEAMQRIADEQENAQMAIDIQRVNQSEKSGDITAAEGIAQRARIRQRYADRATDREIAGNQNKIDTNQGNVNYSNSELQQMLAVRDEAQAALKELNRQKDEAFRTDRFNEQQNKLLPKDRQLPTETAQTYLQAIRAQEGILKKSNEALKEKQTIHDDLAKRMAHENSILETQIRNVQQLAKLKKEEAAITTGMEITDAENKRIDKQVEDAKKEAEEKVKEEKRAAEIAVANLRSKNASATEIAQAENKRDLIGVSPADKEKVEAENAARLAEAQRSLDKKESDQRKKAMGSLVGAIGDKNIFKQIAQDAAAEADKDGNVTADELRKVGEIVAQAFAVARQQEQQNIQRAMKEVQDMVMQSVKANRN